MADDINGQRHDRRALVLYGSETGNSQDVAEELGRMAERLHFVTRVSEMDLLEIKILLKCTVVIFVIATTGQGEFPKNARKFWKSLLRKRLPPDCLGHVSFTTFGLGDSSYPKFNWSARKLHKRLEQLGAKEVYPRGEADEQHQEGIDGTFLPWRVDLNKHLLSTFPLPEGISPIPPDMPLPPKFLLELLESNLKSSDGQSTVSGHQAGPSAQGPVLENEGHVQSSRPSSPENELPGNRFQDNSTNNNRSITTETTTNMKYLQPPPWNPDPPPFIPQLKDAFPGVDAPIDEKLPSARRLPIPGSYKVELIGNKRVTPADHWQDVRELTFLVNERKLLQPGDVMTIYPKNFPEDVQSLIDLMGWEEVADKPLKLVASGEGPDEDPFDGLSYVPSGLHLIPESTLRDLLTHNLDITAIPKRSFLDAMALCTTDKMHKERLEEFTNPNFTDEFFDYTTRPRRSILEVLADFPSVKLPWNQAACIFPIIRGRQFSITSGGCLKLYPEKGFKKVQILVAIVKYKTVIKKIRQGVCSRYLASLPEHTRLRVTFSTGSNKFYDRAKISPHLPIIMVAPGTGVAPCRALIWERSQLAYEHEDVEFGHHYLIFGGRNENADYFYKDEWKSDHLSTTVFTAFSRDQKHKIYVQDVIRQQGKKLYDLMTNNQALIYVCGSSGAMPKAVREAFIDVMLEHDGLGDFGENNEKDRERAVEVLEGMEKYGYYIQETW